MRTCANFKKSYLKYFMSSVYIEISNKIAWMLCVAICFSHQESLITKMRITVAYEDFTVAKTESFLRIISLQFSQPKFCRWIHAPHLWKLEEGMCLNYLYQPLNLKHEALIFFNPLARCVWCILRVTPNAYCGGMQNSAYVRGWRSGLNFSFQLCH